MRLVRDDGVVLRTHKLGEADRIVVLFLRGQGKVRAVAKGVRKTTSRFGARLEPLSHVTVQLYAGRQLDTITQAETVESFRAVRGDLDRLARGLTMLEAVDQLTPDRHPATELYTMLLGALRTLADRPSPLVTPAFFLKALALEGYRPVVETCVMCGASDELVAFDEAAGGVRCRACRAGVALSPGAHTLLCDVLGGRLTAALEVAASPATAEVEMLATSLLEHHLERRLRSTGVDLMS